MGAEAAPLAYCRDGAGVVVPRELVLVVPVEELVALHVAVAVEQDESARSLLTYELLVPVSAAIFELDHVGFLLFTA